MEVGIRMELVLCMVMDWTCCCQVETNQVVLKEGGVQLRLTVVDTPGFGDAVNNTDWSE